MSDQIQLEPDETKTDRRKEIAEFLEVMYPTNSPMTDDLEEELQLIKLEIDFIRYEDDDGRSFYVRFTSRCNRCNGIWKESGAYYKCSSCEAKVSRGAMIIAKEEASHILPLPG